MPALQIRPISIDSERAAFDCGNPSIEERIKHTYYASLLQEGYGYEIVASQHLVGYYMITLTVLNGGNIPIKDRQYSSGVYQCLRYPAVEITYLAIDKRYQKKNIGTTVLKAIIKNVRNWCHQLPIRFIMIDALKEKVKWYTDLGFFAVNTSSDAGNCATVKMLIDCLCNEGELNQYVNESGL